MRNGRNTLSSILCGTRTHGAASRALAGVRSLRPVIIVRGKEMLLCLPVEGLDKDRLAAFRSLCAPIQPRIVLTASRARSLGIETDEPVAIALSDDVDSQTVLAWVADNKPDFNVV